MRPPHNLIASSLLFFATAAGATVTSAPPEALARAIGCYLCHNDSANPGGKGVKPLAPSWRDIAHRYANDGKAEPLLIKIVLDGSGRTLAGRNWSNEVSLGEMPAHKSQLTPNETQRIVRWILSSADEAPPRVALKRPR